MRPESWWWTTTQACATRCARSSSSEGLAVDEAGDGVEALARYDAAPAALVLTDLRMPRLDGMELLRELMHRSPAAAGGPHHRPRLRAPGGRGHEGRRLRLLQEALRDRGAARGGAPLHRGGAPQRYENEKLQGELALARSMVFASEAMRRLGVLVGAGGPPRRHRAHHRRERHRQGAGGRGHRARLAPRRTPLHPVQLRRALPRAGRGRALRPRQGRLHRRRPGPPRPVRRGGPRHPPARRGRRAGAQRPGQAAAGAAGGRGPAGGRGARAHGRRAGAGGHPPRPRGAGPGRAGSARTSSTGSTWSTCAIPPLRSRPEDIPLLARFFLERFAERFGVSPLHVPEGLFERL